MGADLVKVSKKKDRTVVSVRGTMTVSQAVELQEGLLQAFQEGKGVEIQLSEVTEVDITGLQLMCSSHRTSLLKQVPLTITGGDARIFFAVAEQAGMLRHTGCSQDLTGTCVWRKEL